MGEDLADHAGRQASARVQARHPAHHEADHAVGVDVHRDPDLVPNYALFLSVGWSAPSDWTDGAVRD